MTSTLNPTQADPNAHNGEVNTMPNVGQRPGKRVFIETYGCQMNLADSELMGGVLSTRGYTAAPNHDEADVILINTCAVRERAEERVFGRLSHLLRYKNERPEVILGVTGCMAERLREVITERAPYVDLVIGPDAYRRLPELLEQCQEVDADPVIDVKLDRAETYTGLTPERRPGISGWVTVQRGCDKFCTFCIVPFVRGRERGVSPEEILTQCRDMAARGYKEVTLLGQTVNSYKHEDTDFADLLEEVVKVEGIERVRFTSPYPTDFTPKLIATMAKHDKICNYLHLPLQSGSDRTLEEMKRLYTSGEFFKLVDDIRAAIPDIAMSTDIIVGFPGETEEDYEETVAALERIRFDFAYLFKYSERDGTYASRKLPDTLDEKTKGRRLAALIARQEAISAEIFQNRIGTTVRVMVEGESRRDAADLCGRSDDFKMTVFPKPEGRELMPGDFVNVRITDATSHTLLGEIVEG
ncbi:tRNA (N6-isopentenyl adenosine(37)-C2)-methylthiotransferase MiaB [Lujinxingia vulgaris]|nr:tRNA (N6-isopentenyl adenosine(37)-C2)-methylthiotransferase MiaB [Lujinxingia vulgaris]